MWSLTFQLMKKSMKMQMPEEKEIKVVKRKSKRVIGSQEEVKGNEKNTKKFKNWKFYRDIYI